MCWPRDPFGQTSSHLNKSKIRENHSAYRSPPTAQVFPGEDGALFHLNPHQKGAAGGRVMSREPPFFPAPPSPLHTSALLRGPPSQVSAVCDRGEHGFPGLIVDLQLLGGRGRGVDLDRAGKLRRKPASERNRRGQPMTCQHGGWVIRQALPITSGLH